jgi:hypothetical protein
MDGQQGPLQSLHPSIPGLACRCPLPYCQTIDSTSTHFFILLSLLTRLSLCHPRPPKHTPLPLSMLAH